MIMVMIIGIAMVMLGVCYALWMQLMLRQNQLKLRERTPETKVKTAILVAARGESKVIRNLFDSLAQQSYPVAPEDIYVIVEQADDPTVATCKQRGISYVVRTPPFKHCKGAALDEAVKQILADGKHYDLYFVFDADNKMQPTYVEKMVQVYQKGYDMATGYRYPKNGNANIIAAVSSLTFSMINAIGNRTRKKHQGNVIFSGTGCFVAGDLVERWQGWPFQSLTEDYEMSLWATLHGIPTFYHEDAAFYDEQPVKYRQTVAQRVRWIRGYFDARKIYVPKIRKKLHQKRKSHNYGSLAREAAGVTPLILIVVGLVLISIATLVRMFYVESKALDGTMLVGLLVLIYLVLMVATGIILHHERIRFTSGMKVKILLFNPLYLLTYIYCAAKAILSPKVEWTKIDHGN